MTGTPARGSGVAASELALVGEQLWPSSTPPNSRVVEPAGATPGWIEVERHRVVGRKNRMDQVLPLRASTAARSLLAYARLRPLRPRIARITLATAVLLGVGIARRTIALEVRADAATENDTVLRQLRKTFGDQISASMHVRRTANRKALLQLVDRRGLTVGFAKLARSEVTSTGIRNETRVLQQLDGGSSTVRTPRVLAAGECGPFPYVVTEPLPLHIRAVSAALADTPSIDEFVAVAPLSRHAAPAATQHVLAMRARMAQLREAAAVQPLLEGLDQLLAAIERYEEPMPVAKWWHGDFAFWNVGRTPDGRLWCWDFENVEHDALAGLDVVHWHASRRRDRRGPDGVGERKGILSDSLPVLHALGLAAPAKLNVLFDTYIAEIALRTLETAATDGWSRTWTSSAALASLMRNSLEH